MAYKENKTVMCTPKATRSFSLLKYLHGKRKSRNSSHYIMVVAGNNKKGGKHFSHERTYCRIALKLNQTYLN